MDRFLLVKEKVCLRDGGFEHGDHALDIGVVDQRTHRSFVDLHSGTLNESTSVGVKIGGPRGRGSRAVDLGMVVIWTR